MAAVTLEKQLSVPLSKKQIGTLASASELDIEELYRLTFHPEKQVAFRAAWVLEVVVERNPPGFAPIAGRFLAELAQQQNRSCQRHFTKIAMFLTDPRAPEPYRAALERAERERMVETVFDWLINPRTPVAVAVNCLDILFHLSTAFDWIGEELEQQILLRIDQGSPAMDSRGKRVLKKIQKAADGGRKAQTNR